MLNPRCPNCSYVLVLLERRLKYKCASCGKLYQQKQIENRTFREWNKKQKELDLHNHRIEHQQELSDLRRLKKSIKQLFKPTTEKRYIYSKEKLDEIYRRYYNRNRAKILLRREEYYLKNQEKMCLRSKEQYIKNKEKLALFDKENRLSKYYRKKVGDRLARLRLRHKVLALSYLENDREKASTDEIFQTPFTFLHSNLLD